RRGRDLRRPLARLDAVPLRDRRCGRRVLPLGEPGPGGGRRGRPRDRGIVPAHGPFLRAVPDGVCRVCQSCRARGRDRVLGWLGVGKGRHTETAYRLRGLTIYTTLL